MSSSTNVILHDKHDNSSRGMLDAQEIALQRTATIIEDRLKNNQSQDQIKKDLAFLLELYRSRQEWDKASAVSRHMLNVAEGDAKGIFEITPVDTDYFQTRKKHERRITRRLCYLLAVSLFLLVVELVCINEQGQILLIKPNVLFWDAQPLIERARYYQYHGLWSKALEDVDKAITVSHGSHTAYREKASMLLCLGDIDSAAKFNELDDHRHCRYLWTKATIEANRGEFTKAANILGEVDPATIDFSKSYWYRMQSYYYAAGGDFLKALHSEEVAASFASIGPEKYVCYEYQARWLLRLGRVKEALDKASAAIALDDTWARARLYRAEALYIMKDYSGAIRDASLYLDMYSSGRALTVRANAFAKLGNFSSASVDRRNAARIPISVNEAL